MTPSGPIDLGGLLDAARWTGYQKWLVLLTAVSIIFDGFDNQLLGLALPSIMQDWGVPRSAFAPVVSLGYLGMMIGGALAGLAGDRLGRRTALLGSMATFAAATLAIAAANGLTALTLLRLVAGIGLGGAVPNAAALAAEYVPLSRRPLAVTLAIVCVPLGGVLAGLFAVPAIPALGWRGTFLVGGLVPLILAFGLTQVLPESPRYLAKHPRRWPELSRLLRRMGHAVPAEAAYTASERGVGSGDNGDAASSSRVGALIGRAFVFDTIALWAAFLSCLLAVYLGFSWLPSILTTSGLGAAVASTSLTVFNLGGVAGAIAGAALITRYGSKLTMLVMAAGAAAGALVLSRMEIASGSSVLGILTMLTITGGLINAVQTTMYALAAHVYPTSVRATGVGTASAVGRTGAILSGFAGPWVLDRGGAPAFFGLMAATLVVTLLSLAAIRRHVPRR